LAKYILDYKPEECSDIDYLIVFHCFVDRFESSCMKGGDVNVANAAKACLEAAVE